MSDDNLKVIDERCGTTNNITALSVFSATSSGVLMLLTIPLNGIVIYCILKERKRKFKSLFYKLLLNIAFADLLTGLVADPSSVNALVKEALKKKFTLLDVYIVHLALFFTDAVALITITILSIDRITALVFPIKHHRGVKKRTENLLVFVTWPIGLILVSPYFKLHFIKQLAVFSIINVVVAILSLIVTTITYKRKTKESLLSKSVKLKQQQKPDITLTTYSKDSTFDEIPLDQPDEQTRKEEVIAASNRPIKISKEEITKPDKLKSVAARGQRKATRTFLLMLSVFVATYLPTCFTMLYMNVCRTCDCIVIHVMRDISILSILSSSVLRPITFICTLKHLRTAVHVLFYKRKPNNYISTTDTQNTT